MVEKIAALVAERDKALRAHDRELAAKLTEQLTQIASAASAPVERAAKRIIGSGEKR